MPPESVVVVRGLGCMMQPNACPKCFGVNSLVNRSDQDGPYLTCLHCGHLIDLLQPEPEVLARLVALRAHSNETTHAAYNHNRPDGGGRRNKGQAGFYGSSLSSTHKVWPQR
mgnify:FL=1